MRLSPCSSHRRQHFVCNKVELSLGGDFAVMSKLRPYSVTPVCGSFVNPGFAGTGHVCSMTSSTHGNVQVGEVVKARVISSDPASRRLSLSLVPAKQAALVAPADQTQIGGHACTFQSQLQSCQHYKGRTREWSYSRSSGRASAWGHRSGPDCSATSSGAFLQ